MTAKRKEWTESAFFSEQNPLSPDTIWRHLLYLSGNLL